MNRCGICHAPSRIGRGVAGQEGNRLCGCVVLADSRVTGGLVHDNEIDVSVGGQRDAAVGIIGGVDIQLRSCRHGVDDPGGGVDLAQISA